MMISLHFDVLISFLLSVSVLIFFGLWIFLDFRKESINFLDLNTVHQCPYCTHIFVVYIDNVSSECPVCSSIISDG